MNDERAVLAEIDAAFASVIRPQRFTVEDGDLECLEHDAMLKARTPDTLSLEDVGNVCWDPLCECLPEGMAYFFPKLARFALEAPAESTDWYGNQLLFHLSYQDAGNEFLRYCSQIQRAAVASLLGHLMKSRQGLISDNSSREEFAATLALWRGQRL